MALIVAYIFSLIGRIAAYAMDYIPIGVIIGMIGVIITIVHNLVSDYHKVGWLVSLLPHVLIWILSGELMGKAIGLVFAVCLAIILIVFLAPNVLDFLGLDDNNNSTEMDSPTQVNSLSQMPEIVYDSGNVRWIRQGIYGDHSLYYNDNGDKINIYVSNVSGNSASTDKGQFYWY